MKRISIILMLGVIIFMLMSLAACTLSTASPPSGGEMTAADEISMDSFKGKRFAIEIGTGFEDMAHELFDASEVLFFAGFDGMIALVSGRADCTIVDLTVAIPLLKQEEFSSLTYYTLPDDISFNQYAAIAYDQYNMEQFNTFLKTIKADGTFDDMVRRWVDEFDPDDPPPMPDVPTAGGNGTLRAVTSSVCMPFAMIGSGNRLVGLEVELMERYAASQGKTAGFTDVAYDALLPYIMSGKADISAAMYFYTEERSEGVFYTDPYYDARTAVIYRKADFANNAEAFSDNEGGGFIEWLQTGIRRNLITDNRWKMVVNGLSVTMIISVLAQVFGTVFGCFVCWLLTRKNKFVLWIGNFYCGLIHGTPIVVLLMITYYIIFGSTEISNVLIAVAAFTMITGADVAGNLRGAIDTVDPVEIEAARSIGFSALGAFLTVTLPQAVRRALPGYTNGFVELVKATAIVGYIAIQDLTRAGDIIRSRTYDAYFPLLLVAIIYLIMTTICVQIFKLAVKRINGSVK